MRDKIDTVLKRGKRCRGSDFSACCGWSWLLVSGNLILLSAFLLDGPVAAYLQQHTLFIRPLGSMVTHLGKSDWILIGSFILLLEAIIAYKLSPTVRGRFQAAFVSYIAGYIFICISLSGLLANLLKRVIGRARPTLYDELGSFSIDSLAGNARFESFPSGHATTIGALMMALALIAPAYRLAFIVAAIWLGFSRVIVGAHYPSDVIAGLTLGAWFSLATAIVFSRYGLLFRQKPNGWPVLRHPLPLSMLPPSLCYRNTSKATLGRKPFLRRKAFIPTI